MIYLDRTIAESDGFRERRAAVKKFISLICALSLAFSGIVITAYAESSDGTLSGETSRSVSTLYPGVTLTKYSLSAESDYGLQEFSTVEFNPKQKDLYFDVTGGGDYASKLVTPRNTIRRFNDKNAGDKTAIAAVNGDMWMIPSYHVRVEGSGTVVDGYSDAVVTKAYALPRGFSMYGGEIICTTNMVQETPYNGTFQSFGISSDGEAMLGNIITTVRLKDRTKNTICEVDGINRLPANNALVMYTDKGYASNYALSDAYEVVVDCPDGYRIKQGSLVSGTVAAITKPGEEKLPMKEGRLIFTARGSALSKLASFEIGDEVNVMVSIRDDMGNTEKWQTVTNCVGGHMPIVINGDVQQNLLPNTVNYPTSILGIKEDGKVVMLTSYGRQTSTGYSVGFAVSDLHSLCEDLGIVTAFLLDGGGSASMSVTDGEGGYELTGRPCDKDKDGNYGKERAVVNSVILSYGHAAKNAYVFDSAERIDQVKKTDGLNAGISAYSLALAATGRLDPSVEFAFLGANAASNGYAAITVRADTGVAQDIKLGIFVDVGDTYTQTNEAYKQLEFESTGEWQTIVVKLSDLDAWYGRIFGVKLVLNGSDGALPEGKGIKITAIRFFDTAENADAYANNPRTLGDAFPGDVNSDGTLDMKDVVLAVRALAGWDIETDVCADYDSDGNFNMKDLVMIIRTLVNKK